MYILVICFGKKLIFSVKNTYFLFFRTKCTFWVQNSSFIQNLYILVKCFGKNASFSVESTIFLFFQDQMYIFGYKTLVFIQNLYILVKFFGKNAIFSVKSTIFFSRPNVHFWEQNSGFYPKFVHFGEILW